MDIFEKCYQRYIQDEVREQGFYDQWLEEATVEAENLGL